MNELSDDSASTSDLHSRFWNWEVNFKTLLSGKIHSIRNFIMKPAWRKSKYEKG